MYNKSKYKFIKILFLNMKNNNNIQIRRRTWEILMGDMCV